LSSLSYAVLVCKQSAGRSAAAGIGIDGWSQKATIDIDVAGRSHRTGEVENYRPAGLQKSRTSGEDISTITPN